MITVNSVQNYGTDEVKLTVTRINRGGFQAEGDKKSERELASISPEVKASVEPLIEQLDLLPKDILRNILDGKSGVAKILGSADVQASLVLATDKKLSKGDLSELERYSAQLLSLKDKVSGDLNLVHFLDELNNRVSEVVKQAKGVIAKKEAEEKKNVEIEKINNVEAQGSEAYVADGTERENISSGKSSYFAPSAEKTQVVANLIPDTSYGSSPDTYSWGNCTWGVKAYFGSRVGDYWGNAKDWGVNAMNAGFVVDENPVAWNTVAVFVGGVHQSSVEYGHVAVVSDVQGDQVEIYEMNAEGGLGAYNYRWIPKSGVSFIHV